jgi:hypothetical protein
VTEVLTVRRTTADTPCTSCRNTIERGQRAALLAGIGTVHLRCLLTRAPTGTASRVREPAPPTLEVSDSGRADADPWASQSADTASPAVPDPVISADDDEDSPWWQR